MRRILVTGKSGQVGLELQGALKAVGEVRAVGREELDLRSADSIRACIREVRPDMIVNAAGYTRVDDAESQRDLAMLVNGVAPGVLAEEAKRIGAILVHYSTDYVFAGKLGRPYFEDDETHPVNAYGLSKLEGERAIVGVGGAYLILRTSWVYSNVGTNFVLAILRLARERKVLPVVDDQTGSPNWARMLAEATAQLLREPEQVASHSGIYHLSAAGTTSRYEFARAILRDAARRSGSATGWARVVPISSEQYPHRASRPLHLATDKSKIKRVFGVEMPGWRAQLSMYMSECFKASRSGTGGR
jgi:dTDP-4-dehydrorhamnose reductase